MVFHVFYQNVCGLRTKLNKFRVDLQACDFDIVVITESWLNNDILDPVVVDMQSYTVFRRDRETTGSSKYGGGVLVATHKRVEY